MTLEQFNVLPVKEAKELLFRCCGCTRWVNEMGDQFPFKSVKELKAKSDVIWRNCDEGDWLEAFSHHPKIGQRPEKKHESTSEWAQKEQSGVQSAAEAIKNELAEGNYQYEKKFGFIFIVCATGKSAEEMLTILKERLKNNTKAELSVAAEEQNKITHLRIDKLLS